MSLNISQYGYPGANIILNQGIKRTENAQADVAWQSTEGTISSTIAGLGNNASAALTLSPKLAEIAGYQANLTSVQSRLTMSSNALTQITTLAQNLTTQVLGMMNTEGSQDNAPQAVATSAQQDLSTLGNILNTSDGNGYIFGGVDSNTKPVTSPSGLSTSTLAQNIQSTMSNFSTSGDASSAMKAATGFAADNSSDGMSVFSSSLSVDAQTAAQQQGSVIIGANGASASSGPVATEGSSAASSTSTGSPIRDLMRDMMMLSSMKGMNNTTTGFNDLVQQLHSSLQNTSNQIIAMNSAVGVTQNTLKSQQGVYSSLSLMVKTQLSNNLDVNLSEVATHSSDLTTQLKASFMLIADSKDLSLANYI